jgi:hypothetical protein
MEEKMGTSRTVLVAAFLAGGLFMNSCGTNTTPPSSAPTASAPAGTPAESSSPAKIPGPVPGTRINEAYLSQIGRYIYAWGWPLVNVHNRSLIMAKIPEPGYMGGIVPMAPVNQLSMLHDYVEPAERMVACPNQDVAYGFGLIDLSKEPVVVQVPDFGNRFWVYQVVDQRTDSFAHLGKMYSTKPGFYLFATSNWNGTVPSGITAVFHSPTSLGVVIPRVFKDDTSEDTQAIQPIISKIMMYPLSKFTGQQQTKDWLHVPNFPLPTQSSEETKWVDPNTFFDELGEVLKEAPPLPGEEALYANIQSVLDAAAKDPKLHAALVAAANDAEKNIVTPLFQFHNYGIPLPHYWTTQNNGAEFGTDYYTRLAVGKSNIFVNMPNETKYFYQDLDESGAQLNGSHAYTVTFPKAALPPVKGFWSLTLYNEHHFFSPNEIKRYSVGTKNKTLVTAPDGSLTVYVQATPPEGEKKANWLPAPKDNFTLYIRAYWPEDSVLNGNWTPPAVMKVK